MTHDPRTSIAVGRFAVLDWAWAQTTGSTGAKATLLALVRRVGDVMTCWPEIGKDLCEATEAGASTVRRHLTALANAGLIRRVELKWKSDGAQAGNLYVINMMGWAEQAPTDGELVDLLDAELQRIHNDAHVSVLPDKRTVMDRSTQWSYPQAKTPPLDLSTPTNNHNTDITGHRDTPPLSNRDTPPLDSRGAPLSNRDTEGNRSRGTAQENQPPPPAPVDNLPTDRPNPARPQGATANATVTALRGRTGEEEESHPKNQTQNPDIQRARDLLSDITANIGADRKPTAAQGWDLINRVAERLTAGWSYVDLAAALGAGRLHGVDSVYAVMVSRLNGTPTQPPRKAAPAPRTAPRRGWCGGRDCDASTRRLRDPETAHLTQEPCPRCGETGLIDLPNISTGK